MTGTKLVVNASLLLATARARCVFVHVAVSVRLPSPRALRRNFYIYTGPVGLCNCKGRFLVGATAVELKLLVASVITCALWDALRFRSLGETAN